MPGLAHVLDAGADQSGADALARLVRGARAGRLPLRSITPRPSEMKQEPYERTLRARAFDISRYLLPLATNTSLGEIVNARTLETQVAHLLSQPHREVRELGELLKKAATGPRY